MAMQTKIGYGNKTDIDTAITSTTIDEGDIIFTEDTNEIAFVKPDKSVMYPKDRTSKDYTLNGTSLGALQNGEKIPEGTSIDDLLNMITQKAIMELLMEIQRTTHMSYLLITHDFNLVHH